METRISEISYKQYGRCVELSNGEIDLVITVDRGPRVIRFGFTGGDNEFCDNSPVEIPIDKDTFIFMGGHRLWHSPEHMPRTYMPDNNPVDWIKIENGVRLVQKVEPWAQTQKEMEITMSPNSNDVKIVHKLTNKNAWPVEFAAWGITIMAPGGMEVIPQPKRETGLLANRLIALWPYTKMNDPRVHWGENYIVLNQNPNMKEAFKLGIPNEDGWAAYFNHGNLFIKKMKHEENQIYPDYGVSYETYTTDYMLEMESLSPLKLVNPDESIVHIEEWKLVKNIEKPDFDEVKIQNSVEKYLK